MRSVAVSINTKKIRAQRQLFYSVFISTSTLSYVGQSHLKDYFRCNFGVLLIITKLGSTKIYLHLEAFPEIHGKSVFSVFN